MNDFPEEEHRPDDDPTEELPVLSEGLLALAAEGHGGSAAAQALNGGEHVLVDAEAAEREADGEANPFDHGRFGADPPEASTIVLEESWSDLEQERQQREDELLALNQTLAAARTENQRRRRAQERLAEKLAHRSAQLAQLLQQLREARVRIAQLEGRLEADRQHQATLETTLERTRLQLVKWRDLALSAAPRHTPGGDASRRADRSSVSGTVVNLLRWWQDMGSRATRYRARVLAKVLQARRRHATSPGSGAATPADAGASPSNEEGGSRHGSQ